MTDMGKWKLAGDSTKCIVASSGVVALESKDPEQVADFSLRYWWLLDEIKKNPKASEYQMSKTSYIGLVRAFADNRLDDLGKIITEKRTVWISSDQKRDYQLTRYTQLPKCGGDLLRKKYKSRAMEISLVMATDVEIKGEENGE